MLSGWSSFFFVFLPEMAYQSGLWCVNSSTIVDLTSEMSFGLMGFSDVFTLFELLNWFLHCVKLLFHLLIEALCFLEFLLKFRHFLSQLTILSDDDFIIFDDLLQGIGKRKWKGIWVGEKWVVKVHLISLFNKMFIKLWSKLQHKTRFFKAQIVKNRLKDR